MSTVVEFRDPFRLVEEDTQRLRRAGRGTWYCRCGGVADVERANPRCDVCRAGGYCGRDCALTALRCPSCGATA